ncbi:MAG TPA: MurT ligase domain-containing protein [Candidatus Limnocylindria bacterium]|nr:MurT ligase domain-containing protein [Candidatus Limnocylindria bacterium]
MPDALALLANAAGKLTREGLRATGRGATALPGVVALTLDPNFITELSSELGHGVVCVSGTNGKTTTARMLADIARTAGWAPIHNRSGSNLDRGVAAALLAATNWSAEPSGDFGLFEIDEASLPSAVARLRPRVVVVTNLFRDQMDRYFELDALAKKIGDGLAGLPGDTTLVLNADDPLVANLALRRDAKTLFFGVDDDTVGGSVPQAISDATRCPRCRSALAYRRVVLAHVGDWSCPSCGLARPPRDIAATRVTLGDSWTELTLAGTVGSVFEPVRIPIPGLYNAYNALAALAGARALDMGLAEAIRAIGSFRPAFGRLEAVELEGRTLRLILVKNPAGFNAATSALLETGRKPRILAALSDRDADGRDVSWIWDADFETLAPAVEHAVITGLRGRDLALRFKYAGLSKERIEVVDGWRPAIERAVTLAPRGSEIVVLATYTAMQGLRDVLAGIGAVAPFWED